MKLYLTILLLFSIIISSNSEILTFSEFDNTKDSIESNKEKLSGNKIIYLSAILSIPIIKKYSETPFSGIKCGFNYYNDTYIIIGNDLLFSSKTVGSYFDYTIGIGLNVGKIFVSKDISSFFRVGAMIKMNKTNKFFKSNDFQQYIGYNQSTQQMMKNSEDPIKNVQIFNINIGGGGIAPLKYGLGIIFNFQLDYDINNSYQVNETLFGLTVGLVKMF